MRYNIEAALRASASVCVPPVPLESIRNRAGRRIALGRARRSAVAMLAAAICIALLAVAVRTPQTWHTHAPTPIASTSPSHAVT